MARQWIIVMIWGGSRSGCHRLRVGLSSLRHKQSRRSREIVRLLTTDDWYSHQTSCLLIAYYHRNPHKVQATMSTCWIAASANHINQYQEESTPSNLIRHTQQLNKTKRQIKVNIFNKHPNNCYTNPYSAKITNVGTSSDTEEEAHNTHLKVT